MLLISSVYSALFYFLDSKVGQRDLLLESFIFFVLWVLFFIYFKTIHLLPEKEVEEKASLIERLKIAILNSDLDKKMTVFSYYIGISTFYAALYFFSKHFEFDFAYLILSVNLISFIIAILFLQKDFSYKILKVNSNIFSLYYLYNYIFFTKTWDNLFWLEDYLSILILFLSFVFLLYQSGKFDINNKVDKVLVFYFVIYIFSTLIFIFNEFLPWNSLLFLSTLTCLMFYFVLFEFLSNIKYIDHYSLWFRIMSILFLYLWIILWNISLYLYSTNLIIIVLIIISTILYFIHHKYQNYISFLLSFINILTILFYFLKQNVEIWSIEFLLFVIILCLSIVLSTFKLKLKFKYDLYFMHIMAYALNFSAVSYFFFKNGFDFLNLWIILLINSVLFFMSFKRLSRK